MAGPKEIFEQIDRASCELSNKLGRKVIGEFAPRMLLVHDLFHYPMRCINLPGEPLTDRSTTQPVLGVESLDEEGNVQNRMPLAYSHDVKRLGEEKAYKVLELVNSARERGF